MQSRRPDPFPFRAVRDLIGLLRAMHAAARERNAGARVLAHIERVGRELRDAYDLAVATRPDTVGRRAAWARAEKATREVGDLVSLTDEFQPIVLAACKRVRRR